MKRPNDIFKFLIEIEVEAGDKPTKITRTVVIFSKHLNGAIRKLYQNYEFDRVVAIL